MKLRTLALRFPMAVIAAAVLLAYWPLATFGYTLPHGDTLDCWLPWRFFIAACLNDGSLPLWNPLTQMGYPVHADLQGPAWYVEALALGGTIGQPVWLLQALYLGYVTLGGLGMRRVVRTVHGHDGVALVIGLAYALGGFLTGHTMHFYSVISAAWLPWMLDAQLRLLRTPHWRPALSAAVFQSFLLTGGNHTFTILAAYLLLALFAARAMALWRGERTELWRLIRCEALFVLATVLLACGTLWSAVEVIPWMTRGTGLDLATAAGGAFTVRSCISLLMPFATGVDRTVLGTDPTMANGYMGVWVLFWAVLSLMRRRSVTENVLLGYGVVCALAAFGEALPVHWWLWSFLPGMDLFRFPSYFLWGAQFSALVLAGGTFTQLGGLMMRRRRVVLALAGALVLLVAGMTAYAMGDMPAFPTGASLYERMRSLTTGQRVVLSAALLLPTLLGGLWLVYRRVAAVWAWGLLVLVEMIGSTGLAAWNTSIADLSPFAVQTRIDAFPPGPVVPPLEPIGRARDDAEGLHVLWRNTQVFKGRPGLGGFNSFQLRRTVELLDAHHALHEALLRRPLLFLGDPADTGTAAAGQVVLLTFDHAGMEARVTTVVPTHLNVQQAWYPGWQAEVDGDPVTLERANVAGFRLKVPAGEHIVRLRFGRPEVPVLLGISLASLFAALFLLAWTGPARLPRSAGVAALLALTGYSVFGHSPKEARIESGLAQLASEGPSVDLVSTDRPEVVRRFWSSEPLLRCERATDLPALVKAMEGQRSAQVMLACVGLPLPPEGLPLLDDLGWHLAWRHTVEGVHLLRFVRQQPGALGHGLHHDPLNGGQVLVSPASPYTPAYRQLVADLAYAQGDRLCVDLRFRGDPGARAFVVLERKRGDQVVDHEAVPFTCGADTAWSPFMVLRDRRELRDPAEELGIYLWNAGPDTVWVKDLRVRMVGGARVKDGG